MDHSVRMTTREIQPYSTEQLERMLKDIESDLVERKESFSGKTPKTVREAVCAFANDLPNHHRPGVVFIGARDNGRPVGLEVSDTLLRELSDIKTEGNTVPPPTLTAAKHHLRGADMAVITVWPADSPPVKYRGRIWIRVGPRRAVASAQDEQLLNERRRHRDRPYDIRPVGASHMRDLDIRRFEAEYLPAALQQLTRDAVLHRSYEGTNAPSRVYWFNDRMEILSPGGPYGEVTMDNFGTPGLTDYRNPNLAEAMRILGYAQKFGGGIVTARAALRKNGSPPPEFEVERTHVRVALRPPE